MVPEFQLDMDKVIAASVFIASHDIEDLTTGKLLKLLFLADKYHLVRHGRPITGDRYDAMKDGPVPSFAYNIFKEIQSPRTPQGRLLAECLKIDASEDLPRFKASRCHDEEQLSRSDIVALEKTIQQFRNMTFEDLSHLTHKMAAWEKAWKSKGVFRNSAPMQFEDFFEGDTDAIVGAKEDMMEDIFIRQSFAKS